MPLATRQAARLLQPNEMGAVGSNAAHCITLTTKRSWHFTFLPRLRGMFSPFDLERAAVVSDGPPQR